MRIVVNGAERAVRPGITVADVLHDLGVAADARGVAVARNGVVVSRTSWHVTELGAEDRVEVLHAVQGG